MEDENPDQHVRLHNLALMKCSEGNFEEGITLYKNALDVEPIFPEALNNLGLALAQTGRLAEAITCYERATEQNPTFIDAIFNLACALCDMKQSEQARKTLEQVLELLNSSTSEAPNARRFRGCTNLMLGELLKERGRYSDAITYLSKAAALEELFPRAQLELSAAYFHTGNYDETAECSATILSRDPDHPVARLNLAAAFQKLREPEKAISILEKLIKDYPLFIDAHLNYGNALRATRNLAQAIAAYQQILSLDANHHDANLALGDSFMESREPESAIKAYKKALSSRPDSFAALNSLGIALHAIGALEEAKNSYFQALSLFPDYSEAHNNVGLILKEQGDAQSAIKHFQKASEIRPEFAEPLSNLGYLLNEHKLYSQAADQLRRALELKPELFEAAVNLSYALMQEGKLDESIQVHHDAIHRRALSLGARIRSEVMVLAQHLLELRRLPILYKSSSDIEHHRQQYSSHLQKALLIVPTLEHFNDEELQLLRHILFCTSNFYLAYQQMNDKKLQQDYSTVASLILNAAHRTSNCVETLEPNRDNRTSARREKIRLGVASEFLKFHNGTFWCYDWLSNLPQNDYEFYLYSLDGQEDEMTRKFASLGKYSWLSFSEETYRHSLEKLRADDLDILILPDIGMGIASRILSLMRVAPIQCTAWGHPITSGSPAIDYYLSSDLMEPVDADNHYSEKLIRLPNLGLYFNKPQQTENKKGRSDFGIEEGRFVFASMQSLFKYLPQYDFVYPEIARRAPESQILFVSNTASSVTTTFQDRLRNAFEKSHVDFESHVKFVPHMGLAEFTRFLELIDINLDTIGWSGGVTSMRSLAAGCPIVTVRGEFMRGRHTSAMLEMIGVEELIASTPDEYIEVAAKIALDPNQAEKLRKKVRSSSERLFEDGASVDALDRFFKEAVESQRKAKGENPATS